MQINWIKIWSVIALWGLLVNTSLALETFYYRYKDSEGHLVITNSLPPDAADHGYEIISPRGNVIQTIEPAKTKEELAGDQKALEEKRQTDLKMEAHKKLEALQAKKDDILLKSFSTEEDIVRSRDEKITSIEILEQIMHENIIRLKKQLQNAIDSKANYEKTKQVVPETLTKTVMESERQIKDNEAFLTRKKLEKENIHIKYQGLVNRFHELNKHDSQVTPSSGKIEAPKTPE